MKSLWSIRAKKDLNRITEYISEHFSHELAEFITQKLMDTAQYIERYPELGRKIGNHFHKRYIVIDGNILIYEIVLNHDPMIVVRAIRPRKSITV